MKSVVWFVCSIHTSIPFEIHYRNNTIGYQVGYAGFHTYNIYLQSRNKHCMINKSFVQTLVPSISNMYLNTITSHTSCSTCIIWLFCLVADGNQLSKTLTNCNLSWTWLFITDLLLGRSQYIDTTLFETFATIPCSSLIRNWPPIWYQTW